MKDKLQHQLEVNGEFIKTLPAYKCNTDVSQGGSDKSECKYCEIGKHLDFERDAEERPLLDANSDWENDDSSSRKYEEDEWDGNRCGVRLEVDRTAHLRWAFNG